MSELADRQAGLRGAGESVDELARLRIENEQLRQALESRVLIEQEKGVLAGRHALGVDDAFFALRRAARSARLRIHEVAHDVVVAPDTPANVLDELRRSAP